MHYCALMVCVLCTYLYGSTTSGLQCALCTLYMSPLSITYTVGAASIHELLPQLTVHQHAYCSHSSPSVLQLPNDSCTIAFIVFMGSAPRVQPFIIM